ncbi:hypothetical protein SDJN03_08514, partial [Cucurbita argyrosperma subsp. sororia]
MAEGNKSERESSESMAAAGHFLRRAFRTEQSKATASSASISPFEIPMFLVWLALTNLIGAFLIHARQTSEAASAAAPAAAPQMLTDRSWLGQSF